MAVHRFITKQIVRQWLKLAIQYVAKISTSFKPEQSNNHSNMYFIPSSSSSSSPLKLNHFDVVVVVLVQLMFRFFYHAVFLTFLHRDVNNNIMELLIMAYACKTSSARSIVGVIPYLPYSKQCKMRKRGCIVSKLLAKVCLSSGFFCSAFGEQMPHLSCSSMKTMFRSIFHANTLCRLDDVQIRFISHHHNGSSSKGNTRFFRLSSR